MAGYKTLQLSFKGVVVRVFVWLFLLAWFIHRLSPVSAHDCSVTPQCPISIRIVKIIDNAQFDIPNSNDNLTLATPALYRVVVEITDPDLLTACSDLLIPLFTYIFAVTGDNFIILPEDPNNRKKTTNTVATFDWTIRVKEYTRNNPLSFSVVVYKGDCDPDQMSDLTRTSRVVYIRGTDSLGLIDDATYELVEILKWGIAIGFLPFLYQIGRRFIENLMKALQPASQPMQTPSLPIQPPVSLLDYDELGVSKQKTSMQPESNKHLLN